MVTNSLATHQLAGRNQWHTLPDKRIHIASLSLSQIILQDYNAEFRV